MQITISEKCLPIIGGEMAKQMVTTALATGIVK
jgi:hypothetical protein